MKEVVSTRYDSHVSSTVLASVHVFGFVDECWTSIHLELFWTPNFTEYVIPGIGHCIIYNQLK